MKQRTRSAEWILKRLAAGAFALALLARLLAPAPALAQESSPPSAAEALRSALFDAQMNVAHSPESAQASLREAQDQYAVLAPQLPEEVRALLDAGLARAATALENEDAADFAAARSLIWTALLDGAALNVEEAVRAGDVARAAQWLPLREYRQATRFNRPAIGATVAVQGLGTGSLAADEVLTAVRADLWDAYQARLTQALFDLAQADDAGYAVRRAETAGLAQGYFAILARAYAEQRGQPAADQASAAFAALTQAAAQGDTVVDLLPDVNASLEGFRAAPLSTEERNRRASQIARYLPLVPIEYGRGVSGNRVTLDLEIREAITFAEGAASAFADLKDLLAELNPSQTAQLSDKLLALRQTLAATAAREQVATAAQIDAQVNEIIAAANALIPAEWKTHSSAADFDMVRAALDQMEQAVRSGEYQLAESARLDAYATLESGPEARLTAFAPQFVPIVEGLFWQGYEETPGLAQLLAQKAPIDQIAASRAALDVQLDNSQSAISGQMAPEAVASNAALIVFREGLEAVLILASLLASLRVGEQRKMRSPLWIGVILALMVTLVTWFAARGALTSLARYGEKLEAAVSLIAVIMLLLILNWFFHDIYWKDWMAGFHKRKQRIVRGSAGQWMGLAILGFTSVYREGFETVIFLQALVLEAGTAAVLTGVAIGFAATVLLGLAVFVLQARLPHKKMLTFTGVLIGLVLLQMVGNMVHSFQVVGWMPTHPIRWLNLPYWAGIWFGVYPTWEGLSLQLLAAAFTIGSYIAAERMAGHPVRFWPKKRRASGSAKPVSPRNGVATNQRTPAPPPAAESGESALLAGAGAVAEDGAARI